MSLYSNHSEQRYPNKSQLYRVKLISIQNRDVVPMDYHYRRVVLFTRTAKEGTPLFDFTRRESQKIVHTTTELRPDSFLSSQRIKEQTWKTALQVQRIQYKWTPTTPIWVRILFIQGPILDTSDCYITPVAMGCYPGKYRSDSKRTVFEVSTIFGRRSHNYIRYNKLTPIFVTHWLSHQLCYSCSYRDEHCNNLQAHE